MIYHDTSEKNREMYLNIGTHMTGPNLPNVRVRSAYFGAWNFATSCHCQGRFDTGNVPQDSTDIGCAERIIGK